MVDPLPENYRKSPLAIATYSFSEIVDGTGTVIFFGDRVSISSVSANDEYILTADIITPSELQTNMPQGGDGKDFDVTFRATKVIEGPAFFSLPVSVDTSGVLTPSVEVIHYDGSTETTIVAQTSMPTLTSSGATVYGDRILKVTIPRTKFRVGDTLRLTIRSSTTAGNNWLYHDPTGSVANFPISGGVLKAWIPFEVEI